jgi:hypothetical protein
MQYSFITVRCLLSLIWVSVLINLYFESNIWIKYEYKSIELQYCNKRHKRKTYAWNLIHFYFVYFLSLKTSFDSDSSEYGPYKQASRNYDPAAATDGDVCGRPKRCNGGS